MKQGMILKTVSLKPGTHSIQLDKIYPIGEVRGTYTKIAYLIDNEPSEASIYANQLEITVQKPTTIDVVLGVGYYAEANQTLDNKFLHHHHWSGGDGIFTFNLTNGKDRIDLDDDVTTLFVFGDTFVGLSNPKTHHRIQPHAMPNNSLAYLEKGQLDFKVNQGKEGEIIAFYQMDPEFDFGGTIANQLVDPMLENEFGYVSAYGHQKIDLFFDFYKIRSIDFVDVYNYFNVEMETTKKRGFKDVVWYQSQDNKMWEKVLTSHLKMSSGMDDFESVVLNIKTRYLRLEAMSNHNDETFTEGLFGLNKLAFYGENRYYRDLHATSNSTYIKNPRNSWIWLQDGVVIQDKLYFIPLIVNGDHTQPEGLQFKILGTNLFTTTIKDGKLDLQTIAQKRAPLMLKLGHQELIYGAGIFANTKQADALHPDGYIYVYGYKSTFGFRQLLVARVEAENFAYFDDWTFYADGQWVNDLSLSTPILDHISPEMSVMELREGRNKGKYMAVFTYDTNTNKVAFSLSDHPYGPFTKAQPIFLTTQKEKYQSTTYTYNAKAHPHLSKSGSLLASYNVNTYSFDHNMSEYRVYRPRFINLIDTE